MNLAKVLSLLSLISLVTAHARIRYPRPLAAPVETPAGNHYNGPLRPDGSDFPCKGLHKRADVDKTPSVTWKAGQQTYFEILGHGPGGGEGNLAAHSGGSCQASISFDNGETWKVLHSFQGGCPRDVQLGSNMAGKNQTFLFQIPEQTRAGNALFSWSWVAVTGNRNEYFQNCASVRIDGPGTSTLDDFPDMFVGDMSLTGHIGPGECRSTAGFSLEYPNSGRALTVTAVGRISFKKPTNGKCFAKASREYSTPVVPLSPATTAGSTNGASPSSTVDVNSERPTVPETAPALSTKQGPTENFESTLPTETMLPGSKPSQCSSYTTITDKTRHVSHPDYITCDNAVFKTKPIWVRFSGAAGTRLAPGPVEPFHCGTQGTGWYKGTYPTSIGGTASGTVCYSWPRNSCQWSNQISVTNCGGYYVFHLRAPPACFLRYCTV
ncbi:unnamed protein product [Rotaria magnacalcarata]